MTPHEKSKTVRYLAVTAMLGALSFVLQLFEFPLPFLIPSFVEFDFSDLPALVASFSMGPISGIAVALIKNVLHLPMTTTGCVGELANFLLTATFVGIAGIVYHRYKTRGGALVGSVTGAVAMSVLSVPINYFLTYPIYYNFMPKEAILAAYQAIFPFVKSIYTCLWFFNAPFNLGKGLVISLITFLIYKRISPLIKGKKKEKEEK
jgi:riboflavin transporter FmnP